MSTNIFFDNQTDVSFYDSFSAVQIITDQHHITGTDRWRHETGRDSLAAIDPQLEALVQKQPPSKFGKPEHPSLWYAVHFYLALPALSQVFKKYGTEDPVTSRRRLDSDELETYFPAFPYLAKYYREYHEFVERFGAPSEELWENLLQGPLANAPAGTSTGSMLERLPQYLQQKAEQIRDGQGDSLVGRIVLAYLLEQGVAPAELHLDERVKRYVAPMHATAPNRTLYERVVTAQMEIGELEPYLGRYDEEHSVLLGNFFGLVSWFARPHVVEMIIPGLTGAAEPVVGALKMLFDDIIQGGGPDYTRVPLESLPSMQRFYDTQSVEAIGRLSIVKDILSADEATGGPDGVALRTLAAQLYSVDERKAAWGNPQYYIPDPRRESGFETFRQDIADIIFCAALFAESDNALGTVDIKTLKQLAGQLLQCDSLQRMRAAVQSHRRALNDLAVDWETRFAGHERVRIVRFVRQTFGLDAMQPIPIPLSEINKGFAGSYLDGHTYRLHYQEAGERLELSIPVPFSESHTPTVRYRTSTAYEKPRRSTAGMPYSAWLEVSGAKDKPAVIIPVPGRGSFDPFGRAGSPHGGEVIGFGCSVHHASLIVVLAELASLGTSRSDLERVTEAFMRINPDKHERHDLAAFQLAQIITAFEKSETYTFRDYLNEHSQLAEDRNRPQLSAYTQTGDAPFDWAEPQAARLCYGYPDLYPYHEETMLNPRFSWYDGRTVELPEADIHWHALHG